MLRAAPAARNPAAMDDPTPVTTGRARRFFRAIDWCAFWTATLVSFAVYWIREYILSASSYLPSLSSNLANSTRSSVKEG